MTAANKVWIELSNPARLTRAEQDEQCRLVNNMLARLAEKPEDRTEHFYYSEHEARYCYGGHNGYIVLTDNGHWFNLDYFGRD